jgi:hypothetical protein
LVICSLSVVNEAKLKPDDIEEKLARQWFLDEAPKMVGKERRPDLQRKVKEEGGNGSKRRRTGGLRKFSVASEKLQEDLGLDNRLQLIHKS